MKSIKLAIIVILSLMLVSFSACVNGTTVDTIDNIPTTTESITVDIATKSTTTTTKPTTAKATTTTTKPTTTKATTTTTKPTTTKATTTTTKPTTTKATTTTTKPTTTKATTTTTKPSTSKPSTTQNPDEGLTVYITATGKKYHYENPCGNGKYSPISLARAKELGYDACDKCVLH